MTDKPPTTYVVSVFEEPHWRTVLTIKDKAKAEALAKEIGDKIRVEAVIRRAPVRYGWSANHLRHYPLPS